MYRNAQFNNMPLIQLPNITCRLCVKIGGLMLRNLILITILFLIAFGTAFAEPVSNHFFAPNAPSLGIYHQEFMDTQINRNPHLTEGYKLLVNFRFSQAIRELNKVAHDETQDNKIRSEAYAFLGYAYMNLRETVNCIEALNKSIAFNDQNTLAYYFLAHEYFLSGDFKAVKIYLNKAIEIHPRFVSAMRMLAELYKDEGELEKSAENYRKIIEIFPNSGYFRYQYYKINMSMRDWNEAEKTLKAMIKLQPKYRPNYISLGDVYIKQGKLEEAEKQFNFILEQTPNESRAYEGKAMIFYKQGKLDHALAMARHANTLLPGNAYVKSLIDDIQQTKKQEMRKNLKWIGVMAGFIVIGILLAYFFVSHRRKNYVVSVIQSFNRSVDEIYDMDTLINYLQNFFMDLGGSSKGLFLMFNRQNNDLTVKESSGFQQEEIKSFAIFAGSEITNWLSGSKRYLLPLDEMSNNPLFEVVFPSLCERLQLIGMKYLIPLREKNSLAAFIALDDFHAKGRIIPHESDLLMPLSTTSAQALLALSLYEISFTDETTGVFNKRFFMQNLNLEIKRAERYKQPLTLAVADVDNLKHINKNYGTEKGDLVLREVGTALKKHIRDGIDLVSRTGGGEFSIILPATEFSKAYAAGERLRDAVQRIKFSPSAGLFSENITISIGAASFPEHGKGEKILVEKAKEALEFAKKTGKNKVCMSGQTEDANLLFDLGDSSLRESSSDAAPSLLDESGLYNRAYFDERFVGEIRRSERNSSPCSLILISPDQKLNEEERVMIQREGARVLKANLRRGIDVPSLFEKNIIAVILPEADQHKAFTAAGRIKLLLENNRGINQIKKLSFSIGISNYPNLGRTAESFMDSAQKALKKCREMGGNKIIIASPL